MWPLLNSLNFFKYIFLSLIFFALDQISKVLIKSTFSEQVSGYWITSEGLDQIPIIDPILIFKRLENKGIAFGMDGDGSLSYIIMPVTILLTIGIIVYLYRVSNNHKIILPVSLSLILGGALGNLFDRIFFGSVVDFIWAIGWSYIFNLADTFITIGMILLVFSDIVAQKKNRNDKQRNKNISS